MQTGHVAPHGANRCLVTFGYKHPAPSEQRQLSQYVITVKTVPTICSSIITGLKPGENERWRLDFQGKACQLSINPPHPRLGRIGVVSAPPLLQFRPLADRPLPHRETGHLHPSPARELICRSVQGSQCRRLQSHRAL